MCEFQSSRLAARVDEHGDPIVLADQDRSLWNRARIARGQTALLRAQAIAARTGSALGPYGLQAAIASCHALSTSTASTDWINVVALYDALVECTGSPVVEFNRAIAVAEAYGADEALAAVDDVKDDLALKDYALLPAIIGDLLERVGRLDDAGAAFAAAAARADNAKERALFERRAARCVGARGSA